MQATSLPQKRICRYIHIHHGIWNPLHKLLHAVINYISTGGMQLDVMCSDVYCVLCTVVYILALLLMSVCGKRLVLM